jgi:hypothetical protein
MNTAPHLPLPALLEAAVLRVKQALRNAAERTAQSLGLSALAAHNAFERDAQLAAQFELNQRMAVFVLTFDQGFEEQVRRESRPRPSARSGEGTTTNWDALSLVEDREVEIQVQAERFGLEITHACEWELRELEAYVGSLLGHDRAEHERNPLRPEVVGHAVIRAVERVSDRPEVRRVLDAELKRSLTAVLSDTYAAIVSDLRQAGVQPVSLSVRTTEDRGEHSRSGAFDAAPRDGRAGTARSGFGSLRDGRASASGPLSGRGGYGAADPAQRPTLRGTPIGQVDQGMMELLRRLTHADAGSGDAGGSGWDLDDGAGGGVAPPNLIHANRDQLRQASRGAIDHMVIDVIGSLFDQILSDPKVPPQLARQIARLQLPVLRAALGDPSFFSSRKHPVRQFVNRIASLGNGFDDFDDAQAQTFVAKVRDLVQEIVKGDFDQIETYELRLAALEAFVAEQARKAVDAQRAGATALLQQREQALQLDRHYAQQLQLELQPLAAPEFVRDFVARVWSRVILHAAERDGVTSEQVRLLRQAGRELFMSVQPKTSPAQRKAFLADLPKLMRVINNGLNTIGWPDEKRRSFFGQLMPAHAEALKAQHGRVLDFNLLSRRIEQVLDRQLPTAADLPPAQVAAPVADDAALPVFSPEEAARIGLVDEASVDWDGKVDIDLSAEPVITAVDLELPGLPKPVDPVEPPSGRALADHVQIGFSYQMHLEGQWQKVRLAHVSPGRSFFVFTHGGRHQRTISLTHRMLARLCETGRLRAFESAELLERATARTRRQLAGLAGHAVQ